MAEVLTEYYNSTSVIKSSDLCCGFIMLIWLTLAVYRYTVTVIEW